MIALATIIVIIIGGATLLMVWDIPAPSARVEHAIPDSRIPK